MKILNVIMAACILLGSCGHSAQNSVNAIDYTNSLLRTTQAIRDGFARGDVNAVLALHHPEIEKYFGGNNVVIGKEALRKSLTEMFAASTMEFTENKIESTMFNGETAIETSIFTIKITPKTGGERKTAHGRAMVVYVRYKDSPTGWASIREMAQAAPDN